MSEDTQRLGDELFARTLNEGQVERGSGDAPASTVKPKRGRKSKTPPPSDPLESLDVKGAPHLLGMSPAWQRLYEAIGKAAKS